MKFLIRFFLFHQKTWKTWKTKHLKNLQMFLVIAKNIFTEKNIFCLIFFVWPSVFPLLQDIWFKHVAKRIRSTRPDVFCEKGVLGNFTKFTGKHFYQSLFVKKETGRPATLLKKRLWHRCFSVNFAKFLRTPFLQNTYGGLLL